MDDSKPVKSVMQYVLLQGSRRRGKLGKAKDTYRLVITLAINVQASVFVTVYTCWVVGKEHSVREVLDPHFETLRLSH